MAILVAASDREGFNSDEPVQARLAYFEVQFQQNFALHPQYVT